MTETETTTSELSADNVIVPTKQDLVNMSVELTKAALSGGMPYQFAQQFLNDMTRDVARLSGVQFDLPQASTEAPAASAEPAAPVAEEKLVPAVPIRSSVKPDYIICLEDGKKMKMLKRHLLSRYNMTPAQYRARWNLPADYPMVAPNYAATRRELAKKIGLGRGGRGGANQPMDDTDQNAADTDDFTATEGELRRTSEESQVEAPVTEDVEKKNPRAKTPGRRKAREKADA